MKQKLKLCLIALALALTASFIIHLTKVIYDYSFEKKFADSVFKEYAYLSTHNKINPFIQSVFFSFLKSNPKSISKKMTIEQFFDQDSLHSDTPFNYISLDVWNSYNPPKQKKYNGYEITNNEDIFKKRAYLESLLNSSSKSINLVNKSINNSPQEITTHLSFYIALEKYDFEKKIFPKGEVFLEKMDFLNSFGNIDKGHFISLKEHSVYENNTNTIPSFLIDKMKLGDAKTYILDSIGYVCSSNKFNCYDELNYNLKINSYDENTVAGTRLPSLLIDVSDFMEIIEKVKTEEFRVDDINKAKIIAHNSMLEVDVKITLNPSVDCHIEKRDAIPNNKYSRSYFLMICIPKYVVEKVDSIKDIN